MAEAKIHPPSRSRVAEARAAGLGPLPRVSGLSLAVLALWLVQRELGQELWRDLGALLRDPLSAWTASAAGNPPLALAQARAALHPIGRVLGLALAGVCASLALGLTVIQGPVLVWPRRPRRPIAGPRPSWLPALLWSLGLCALLALGLLDALWLAPDAVEPLIARWWWRVSGLSLGLLLIDAALARERFFRALWLTRREQREEWREAYGAPELRAARAERQRSAGPGEPR